MQRFEKHWFPEVPAKGQGYRCIRVNGLNPVDVTLQQAATRSGLTYGDLRLPQELTVWVDPSEVCYRLGESEGSYCTLATFPSEYSSASSSPSGSECSSPASSPPSTPSQDSKRRGGVLGNLSPLSFNTRQLSNRSHNTIQHQHQNDLKTRYGPGSVHQQPLASLRVKPLPRESFTNRQQWRCDGPPFHVPQTMYRNMNYNNRYYKNILRV